jgi:hypothetical protein
MDPWAQNDFGYTSSVAPVTVNVLANDVGYDGPLDPSSVTILSGPASGSASVDPLTGAIAYTPVAGISTSVQIEYGVRDVYGSPSNAAWLNIQVTHQPPFVQGDMAMTSYLTPTQINVLLNDAPGTLPIDPSSVTITSQPAHGSVSADATTGVVTYTPDGDYAGGDSFQYAVADTAGVMSNTAVVSIYLHNSPPQITGFHATYAGHGYWDLSGTVVDERPANLPVRLSGSILGGDVTTSTNDSGVFHHAVHLGQGPVYGSVGAQATDELGVQSPVVVTYVYGYGY